MQKSSVGVWVGAGCFQRMFWPRSNPTTPGKSRLETEAPPVGVPHKALHQVEVHQPELADGRLQVQVDDMLSAHTLQVLCVAHPGQRVQDLLVPRQLEAKSARSTVVQSAQPLLRCSKSTGGQQLPPLKVRSE